MREHNNGNVIPYITFVLYMPEKRFATLFSLSFSLSAFLFTQTTTFPTLTHLLFKKLAQGERKLAE